MISLLECQGIGAISVTFFILLRCDAREAHWPAFFRIANAKIAGMSTDLDLVGLRYNTAAAVFFVSLWFLVHCEVDTMNSY
jgi:hypothetical protein